MHSATAARTFQIMASGDSGDKFKLMMMKELVGGKITGKRTQELTEASGRASSAKIAKVGASGRYTGNAKRDLMRIVRGNGVDFPLQTISIPFRNDDGHVLSPFRTSSCKF